MVVSKNDWIKELGIRGKMSKPISLRLPQSEYKELHRLAEELGLSDSEVARGLIIQALKSLPTNPVP